MRWPHCVSVGAAGTSALSDPRGVVLYLREEVCAEMAGDCRRLQSLVLNET